MGAHFDWRPTKDWRPLALGMDEIGQLIELIEAHGQIEVRAVH